MLLSMTQKPKALDLFCSAGGATKGLQRAGFYVVGVDIKPQPRYCGDEFHQVDWLCFMDFTRNVGEIAYRYDLIWASPPCQHYCLLAHKNGNANEHPDLIGAVRERLIATARPYVIENVMGARPWLRDPVKLCGTMFDLGIPEAQLWRHRLFECSFPLSVPMKCLHRGSPMGVYGGGGDNRRFGVLTVTGHSDGTRKRGNLQQYKVGQRRAGMGIDWMTNAELSQAIPPAYSEFIAKQFLQAT